MSAWMKKHGFLSLAVLAVAALLARGFWPEAVLVEAVPVRRGPLTVTIEEEGRTRVIDRYVVSAPVDGVTCRLGLDVGDAVERGEVLLGITPLESPVLDARSRAQAAARVASAESAVHAAEAQSVAAAAAEKLAAGELERLKPMLERGLVSREEFDRAATETISTAAARRSADFTVEVARYELEAARAALQPPAPGAGGATDPVPVRSPVDGRVLKVQHECEGPVRTGESLLEIGDPASLEVEVDLLSADAVKVRPGMPVLLDRWGGDQPLEAVVRRVEPVAFTRVSALGVDEQRVLVISDITSPAGLWHRLGDGYRVEARFVLWHEDEVLQVPASSLFRHADGWAVFVVQDGRAALRAVGVGQRNGLAAQILQGLDEGEVVVNHPDDEMRAGVRVRSRPAD